MAPLSASACNNSKCVSTQTSFFGENAITTALASALNNQLSNATDFNQIVQMSREIAQLNVLVIQKNESIESIKNQVRKLKENDSDKLTLLSLLKQSTASRNKLLIELNSVESSQKKLQVKFKQTIASRDSAITELHTSNNTMVKQANKLNDEILKITQQANTSKSRLMADLAIAQNNQKVLQEKLNKEELAHKQASTNLNAASKSALNKIDKLEHSILSVTQESNVSRSSLMADLVAAQNNQKALQNKLKEEGDAHDKTITELNTTNKTLSDNINGLKLGIHKITQEALSSKENVSNHLKSLEKILELRGVSTADTSKQFENIIAGVKNVIQTNDIKNNESTTESTLNNDKLETIAMKMKELQLRLHRSLISGSFTEQLYYITSDYKLRDAELKYINDIFKFASKYNNIDVYITGRADPRGNILYNKKLANNRARFVEQIAINNGIPNDRVHVSSHVTNTKVNENSELHFFDRNTTVVITRKNK